MRPTGRGPAEKVDTTTSGVLNVGNGRASIFSISFDFINPLAQPEIVGTDGWISMQGTGIGAEPFTRWVEPSVESFIGFDTFAAELSEMSRAILDGDQPPYSLRDAWANARAVLALAKAAKTGTVVDLA